MGTRDLHGLGLYGRAASRRGFIVVVCMELIVAYKSSGFSPTSTHYDYD